MIGLFFLVGGLRADSVSELERIVLMTEEFEPFRRIILTIQRSVDTVGPFISPLAHVSADAASGEFEITLSPVDTSCYVGRKLIKKAGGYPVRLAVTFADSQTLQIRGKTIPFEEIVGYNVIDGDQFIFDIYKKLPLESYFREITIGASRSAVGADPVQASSQLPGPVATGRTSQPTESSLQPGRVRDRFAMAIKFSGMAIFSGLIAIALVLALLRFFNNRSHRQGDAKGSKAGHAPSAKGGITQLGLNGDGKEATIRRLMEARGINYDEASIIANISERGKINVEA